MLPFSRVAIIGMGLIGSSIARAIRADMPTVHVTGHDASPEAREAVRALGIVEDCTDTAGAAVIDADLVILCVPVGAIGAVAAEIAPDLPPAWWSAMSDRARRASPPRSPRRCPASPSYRRIPSRGPNAAVRKQALPRCSRGAGAS